MTKLVLLIGPVCAGKSTIAKKLKEERGYDVISSDQIREELYGDFKTLGNFDCVFDLLHSRVESNLIHGIDTVVDATNLRGFARKNILKLAPIGCEIFYFVLNRPIEEKIRDRGWRSEELIHKYEKIFRSNYKNIISGDGDPRVIVFKRVRN